MILKFISLKIVTHNHKALKLMYRSKQPFQEVLTQFPIPEPYTIVYAVLFCLLLPIIFDQPLHLNGHIQNNRHPHNTVPTFLALILHSYDVFFPKLRYQFTSSASSCPQGKQPLLNGSRYPSIPASSP